MCCNIKTEAFKIIKIDLPIVLATWTKYSSTRLKEPMCTGSIIIRMYTQSIQL